MKNGTRKKHEYIVKYLHNPEKGIIYLKYPINSSIPSKKLFRKAGISNFLQNNIGGMEAYFVLLLPYSLV